VLGLLDAEVLPRHEEHPPRVVHEWLRQVRDAHDAQAERCLEPIGIHEDTVGGRRGLGGGSGVGESQGVGVAARITELANRCGGGREECGGLGDLGGDSDQAGRLVVGIAGAGEEPGVHLLAERVHECGLHLPIEVVAGVGDGLVGELQDARQLVDGNHVAGVVEGDIRPRLTR
jgi:hypothetical protein